MVYQIEKGIEIPPVERGRPRLKYPYLDMDVGDSIFVPFGDEPMEKVRSRVAMSCRAGYLRRLGLKFSVRKYKDGMRVWRVR